MAVVTKITVFWEVEAILSGRQIPFKGCANSIS
jgi:hypothetical protein